ncbi:MAG: 2-oxoacid:ferredoxin oxidoreductase subunit beta [Gammaproteobacteria bacterium]
MSYGTKPKTSHPLLSVNELGFTRRHYEGSLSTLCAGCGHDAISACIVEACFNLNLPPHRIAKLSGIGCSSKTPTYFLPQAHGFNSVHGRMPSMATGAALANRDLVYLGVSGDGDTASIGLGQYCHVIRRRLNMLYIVENNGTYGLTKGQFSATNDRSSPSRRGNLAGFDSFDLCALAVQLGAGFVARSFSGDRAQLVPLLESALQFEGFAFIDIVSPCVTFNNHSASTKSYEYVREHAQAVSATDLVPVRNEITAQAEPGQTVDVKMHDGTSKTFQYLTADYDPTDTVATLTKLQEARASGQILTGLISLRPDDGDLHEAINTTKQPLSEVEHQNLCPGSEVLELINQQHR